MLYSNIHMPLKYILISRSETQTALRDLMVKVILYTMLENLVRVSSSTEKKM